MKLGRCSSTLRRYRRAASLVLSAAALTGCGGSGPSAEDVLADTVDRLGTVRSGVLGLSARLEANGRGRFEVRVQGRFSRGTGAGRLPRARLTYSVLRDHRRTAGLLVSTGRRVFATSRGRARVLPPLVGPQLAPTAGTLQAALALVRLRLDDWVAHGAVDDGPLFDGSPTEHVHGRLDTLDVVSDVVALIRTLSPDAPIAAAGTVESLTDAVRSATFDVYTGEHDRILHSARVRLQLDVDPPLALGSKLGRLSGDVRLTLNVRVRGAAAGS